VSAHRKPPYVYVQPSKPITGVKIPFKGLYPKTDDQLQDFSKI